MAVQVMPVQLRATAADANGLPLPLAKIYTYTTGTTTPLTTYTSATLGTPNANPIIAGSDGTYGPIYTDGETGVKVVIQTSAGATVDTIDPVPLVLAEAGVGYFNFGTNALRLFQDTTSGPGNGNSTVGVAFTSNSDGFISGTGTALTLNRNSDGTIASFRTSGTQRGSISISGATTAYNTSSDKRLKTNIAPASEPGGVIDAVQVVSYDWIDGSGHVRWGVVAQDVNGAFPEMVTHIDDTWMIDPSKAVMVLWREVQSLRQRLAKIEG